MVLNLLRERLAVSLAKVGENFVVTLADLVVVLLFLFIGYAVAKFLSYFLHRFLEKIKLEEWIKDREMHDALLGFSLTTILDKLMKLLVVAVFLGVAAESVGFVFLRDIVLWFVGYVPWLIQGVVILVLALLAGDYVTDKIKTAKIPFARPLAIVLEVFIAYTALVIALPLVLPNANVEILKTAFVLLVGGVVLAIGLGLAIAIGLGAKDAVSDIAKSKKKELERFL